MAIQYINVPEKDLSGGIDARSAENQIQETFVLDLLNADIVERRVRKRTGNQGYAGSIPVRVTAVDYVNATNQVCFTLDSAVNLDSAVSLEKLRSSPLVVYGRSSVFQSGDGPFIVDTDTVKYYPKFTIPTRKQFLAPSGTLAISASEHGLGTTNMMIVPVESTNVVSRSYTKVLTDSIEINSVNYNIDIDYTVFEDKNVFVYFKDNDTIAGSTYVAALNHTGSGSETFTITAGTHNLSNFNIIAQFQEDAGATRNKVIPDQFLIQTNGDVTITFNSVTATTYYVLLSTTPVTNLSTGVIGALSSGTVVLSNLTRPWVFSGIYLEQTPGGIRELVYPDSYDYDDATQQLTLQFTNNNATARNFLVYYDYGNLRSNQLCVEDSSVTVDGSDARPQLTIWGLDQDDIYITKEAREAWVNHIDSYRRSGEQRVVSGLGGNLFSARTYNEAAATYNYPILYPDLNARTDINRVLAPLFWETGDAPERTRGYITGTDSGSNWATVTAVEYDTGNGWTKYTISVPAKQILDSAGIPTSLSSVISVASGLEDYLSVEDMSYSRHNGEFKIRQVQDGTNQIFIWVENDTNSADYNDSGVAGKAGVFTDQLTWLSDSPFIAGDVLSSEVIDNVIIATVTSSTSATTVTSGVVDIIQVPGGVSFAATRTNSLITTRTPNPNSTASVDNLVKGDMISYTGIERLLRVKYINTDIDRTVDITSSLGVATVELQSGDTTYLAPGQKILLRNAGVYTGTHRIVDIISSTEVTFETEETDSVTGAILVGENCEVDEELEWADTTADSNYFRVERRWIPIEAPDDSFELTPSTYVRQLDVNPYSAQDFLRSTMVVDNMYFTNGTDEVYKFDGSSLYRAGLLDWQPGLFLTQETTGATIVTGLRSITWAGTPSATDRSAGRLEITTDEINSLPIGTKVRLQGGLLTYTVRDYETHTKHYILFDRSIESGVSTAGGTISEIGTYRYYFRLNMVDANDNIIASAVTGYQDNVVEIVGNAAILLKLVGMPAWDNYDYSRIEVQIYRTQLNQVAPFYLITTLPVDFNNTTGYIEFRDSFADSDLQQLDAVNTALKGAELGTQFKQPLRGKYVTSVGNRLVLGNVRDYPELDIQIVGNATLSNSEFDGDSLLFRRSNTDSGTTTDMINRVRYEWVDGFTGTTSNFVIGSDQFSFDTSSGTGAVAGDWIYLTYDTVATTGRILTYSGWWQIDSVSGVTVTVNLTGAAAAASYPNRYVIATDPTNIPVLLNTDGNLGMVNGDSFDIFDTMRRMSLAINSTMRQVDVSLTGMEEFTPWIIARGGNDVAAAGKLVVRQPRVDDTTIEVVPTFANYSMFVNNIARNSGDQISASTAVFNSRILISYENYPEIFDNPTAILDTESESALDINSADGQEITGVIPFFGEAAFGAAQQSAILVVFKTNSIYLVDVSEKAQGRNAVQRIETEGLGCTAPYSISVTKNGIMFANESGIYCLRRNQTIQYVGRFMERNWLEQVDLDQLAIAHGHHYGLGRLYKLSVPISSTATVDYIEPSEVYVYNHTSEDEGRLGAWARYDAHNAIGWANLGSNAFWASTNGRVFSLRRVGTADDYRDDSSGINFSLTTRPNDFGNSGIRKVMDKAIVHYRISTTDVGTEVNYSVDLDEEYFSTTKAIIQNPSDTNGLGDIVQQLVKTIVHQTERRRGVYFSIQITNSTINETVEIAGIDYRIGGLTDKGLVSAGQTK